MKHAAAVIGLLGAVLPATAPATQAGDAASYSAIVERPLFDPTRRPHALPPPPSPAPVSSPASLANTFHAVLVGVVAGGDRPIALLRDGDGRILRLAVGEIIDGWRISAIALRSVDLERDGMRQSLRLPEPAPP